MQASLPPRPLPLFTAWSWGSWKRPPSRDAHCPESRNVPDWQPPSGAFTTPPGLAPGQWLSKAVYSALAISAQCHTPLMGNLCSGAPPGLAEALQGLQCGLTAPLAHPAFSHCLYTGVFPRRRFCFLVHSNIVRIPASCHALDERSANCGPRPNPGLWPVL